MDTIKRYMEKFEGERVAVAYSGGVDSSLVAYAAKEIADAVTVKSDFTPDCVIEDAKEFAEKFGLRHKILNVNILDDEMKANPPNRCYLCKKRIIEEIKNLGYDIVMDGTNADDLDADRPGLKAKQEEGVISPLADLGLGKRDIRRIMADIDENVARKPSESCLATRIPFNSEITPERLNRIKKAEELAKSMGLSSIRVRDHFPLANIEVPRDEFDKMLGAEDLLSGLKQLGYKSVTLGVRDES
ncbi:MAG: ATP-dependent sacrificial sulfur transferase LarE [Methanocellales archaeon]|nr:ATP-dependent sacrificial sulfur transferase LarE [Methanocellales archaeon]MDD3291899.1 ATP-dependent sacrificial sulfur transferase LarE [Methanocellales archaeon]MDD5235790.1 ATP-dependent sacrificial sulfur transferase LarE [Methanocellales archaeon]MDD5485547.1 ATP-dependent sacrificial sulfur transferase LarE [Methanocellales archaeon]